MKVVNFTIENMYGSIGQITKQLYLDKFYPDIIFGVVRGGLVPAVYLSHHLNLPMSTIELSLRDHKSFNIDSLEDALDRKKKVLLVDDICDSGETFVQLTTILDSIHIMNNELKTATLVYNEGQSNYVPNYYDVTINKAEENQWIVFPWENKWN